MIKSRKSLELRGSILIGYPDIIKAFHLCTDESDHQLGTVIMQDNKPKVIYIRRLDTAQ
jgi:hypothetical protein